MAKEPKTTSREGTVEYQNEDLAPVYVESVQGIPTPRGSLQLTFFSDYISPRETRLTVTADPSGVVNVLTSDPVAEGDFRFVRRIEANLVMTLPALKAFVPWLQAKIIELEKSPPKVQ